MISDAVRKNESNGDLPEVTLALRNTSSVAYGGKYPANNNVTLVHISAQRRRKQYGFVDVIFL